MPNSEKDLVHFSPNLQYVNSTTTVDKNIFYDHSSISRYYLSGIMNAPCNETDACHKYQTKSYFSVYDIRENSMIVNSTLINLMPSTSIKTVKSPDNSI